jgi:hypothetical protein
VKVWREIQPSSGDFTFEPGQRYAVLASVSKDYSLDEVKKKAESEGFDVTYTWEQGDPSRATYVIDNWLQQLAPDTTSNHRWLYAEGNFGGAKAWTVGQDPPWPFSMYHVAHVFQAVDAANPVTPTDTPAEPELPSSSSSAPASSGIGPWGKFAVGVIATAAIGLGVDAYRGSRWLDWNL